jgi:hypothetical protein
MRYEVELLAVDHWRVTNSLPSLDEAKEYAKMVKKCGAKTRVVRVDGNGRMVLQEGKRRELRG